MEHAICGNCLVNDLGEDGIHCPECHYCDGELCTEGCGLCENCYANVEHCPVCDFCFGYENEWVRCMSDGEHCYFCCEENEWLCEKCGVCTEGAGTELCPDCGYCEECCKENTEDDGCIHDYCLESGDYEGHLCPECQTCPEDSECEYCGYCDVCQEDAHCEHELCYEDPSWDDHVCQDCGDCFDPDELCEYCGKCESCADSYHCEHGYCPDGDFDDGDHFVCDQCGECFEGLDRCDYCELCTTCCESNTQDMGCDHDFCIENPDFADHWCYEDDQCLEKCNHNADCAHTNVSSTWNSDGTAHWHVCADCGAAVDKAVHTEGAPVTITEPDTEKRRNGTASVSCNVCNTGMGTVNIPYVPIPEDGSPYIIIQPKDYEGKVSTVDWLHGPSEIVDRYATFTVRAGGNDLTYQWYEQLGTGTAKPVTDDNYHCQGGTTANLKALVYSDVCLDPGYQKYYCVVTNSSGSAQTRTALVLAEHSFGHYVDNGDGTHNYVCNGECSYVSSTRAHRLSEWELIRPATDTETGLLRQECMDCGAKSEKVIPMVEPGHVHAYDQPRWNATEHWFVCRCGIVSTASHASHTWGTPVVTEEPTEKKMGSQDVSCTVCGYTKTERLDKLPHTHDWWTFASIPASKMWSSQPTGSGTSTTNMPNPEYWGHSKTNHYFHCKDCDQLNTEDHVWSNWAIRKLPSAEIKGELARQCQICYYLEYERFEYGTWPIIINNGTASPRAAKPGDVVTITYDHSTTKSVGEPVKFKQWVDNKSEYGDYSIYDGTPGVYLQPLPALANAYAETTTFTMPNGPVAVYGSYQTCNHTNGTVMGERLEPTCKGYGHEPDVLCKDCGMVMTEGARLEALGHLLGSEPIEGTAQPLYCTYHVWDEQTNTSSDTYPTGYGYAGDFICQRCEKTVKGKRTPIVHQMHYTWTDKYGRTKTTIYPHGVEYPNPGTEPTCTTFGWDSDKHCGACHKLLTRGKKISRLGHEWSEWTTVREATTTSKGREQRVCLRNEGHSETRVTDYSGPDYRLKVDKLRLTFEWTYGETPEPQTVTFQSVGRNPVTGVQMGRTTATHPFTYSTEGMQLTITPRTNIILNDPSQRTVTLSRAEILEGLWASSGFTAPTITVAFKIKKAPTQLGFGITFHTMRLGDEFTAPELSGLGEGMTATWQSSNNAVATVDPATGALTIKAPGLTTITAKYAGDDFHTSGQASYTLQVRNPNVTGDVNKDGTISIADVTSLVNIVLGKDNVEPYQYNHWAADTNLDGMTSISDVTSLVNTILGKTAVMYVDDVFTIGGRTVATGTVLNGKFNTGQSILLRSTNDALGDIPTSVASIEMFRRIVQEAIPGDGVGIVVNVDKANVSRGDVLATASTNIVRSKTVKGTMYLLTKDEGGRHTPINIGYSPYMYVGGKEFKVKITDPGTVDGAVPSMIMPGTTAEGIVFEVQDEGVTPLSYVGQQVMLREGGKTIARLTITGH